MEIQTYSKTDQTQAFLIECGRSGQYVDIRNVKDGTRLALGVPHAVRRVDTGGLNVEFKPYLSCPVSENVVEEVSSVAALVQIPRDMDVTIQPVTKNGLQQILGKTTKIGF